MVQKIGEVKLGQRPVVCAVLRDNFNRSLLSRLKRQGIRLAELRIDQCQRRDPVHIVNRIQMLKRAGFSVIATIRIKKEGGTRFISEKKRLALFQAVLPAADAVDVELASSICAVVLKSARKLKKTGIASFHDFKKTPADKILIAKIKRGRQLGASVVKLAVFAKSRHDFERLMNVTFKLRAKRLITISMGQFGAMSRILFPFLGSLVTYGFVESRGMACRKKGDKIQPLFYAPTPGQLSVDELVNALG